MVRPLVVVLCSVLLCASISHSQSSTVTPVRVAAGTVLKFHLQTRLKPDTNDSVDALPKGTILQVKMLDSIDSDANSDGTEFRGSLAAPLMLADGVVVAAQAEVRGLLVLLRSRNHPDGFRYELLVTEIIDRGKSYDLTASLNPSFSDPEGPSNSDSKSSTK